MASESRYLIAAVSRMTGLSADTIRAWERRYQIVTPARDAAGVRRYSEDDVARLEHAREAVERGHAIRHVAPLTNAQIVSLIERGGGIEPESSILKSAAPHTVDDVLGAIESYDVSRAESLLDAAALLLTPSRLIVDVLSPMMRTIGDRWEAGRLSIAQEHLASQLVRNLLATILRTSVVTKKRTMLFAAPTGEQHEFGVLFAASLAAQAGVKTSVLGSNVPAKELLRAARRTRPDIIVLGVVQHAEQLDIARYCRELQTRLRAPAAVWFGGHGSVRTAIENSALRAEFISSLEHFARKVSSLK